MLMPEGILIRQNNIGEIMGRNNKTKYVNLAKPLISVLVPCYNRKEWLPLTIQSLLDQTYTNFEAIFVNDGGESIQDILDKYNDPRFKYFEHDVNKGLPAARNTALRNSHGEYISLLDSDDIYMPLALEFRLSMLKKYNANAVYTRALQNIYEKQKGQNGEEIYKLVHQQLYWNSEFSRDQMLVMNLCPCNCTLISRKAWEDVGYWFDEKLKSGEDYDFWTAISRKYDFVNLKLLDCEDSFRTDNSQMTGAVDFGLDLPRIFKRWRHTAINKEWVIQNQNAILKARGLNPEDYGL
jgi:glycosyltransferase involved in cell wall biosynthesis